MNERAKKAILRLDKKIVAIKANYKNEKSALLKAHRVEVKECRRELGEANSKN